MLKNLNFLSKIGIKPFSWLLTNSYYKLNTQFKFFTLGTKNLSIANKSAAILKHDKLQSPLQRHQVFQIIVQNEKNNMGFLILFFESEVKGMIFVGCCQHLWSCRCSNKLKHTSALWRPPLPKNSSGWWCWLKSSSRIWREICMAFHRQGTRNFIF